MTERDPELDALWRAQSHDEPPPALDDAIRAAAHRAVHAEPVSTTARARSAWPAWAGFAAAASIGAIAIGVWQLQPRDVDETKVVASDVSPSASAPRQEAATRRDASAPSPPAASPRGGEATTKPGAAPSASNAIDAAQRRVLAAPGLPPADVDRQALAAAAPAAPAAPAAHVAPAAPAASDEHQRPTRTLAQNAPAAAAPTPFPAESGNGASATRPAAPPAPARATVAPSTQRTQASEMAAAKTATAAAASAASDARAVQPAKAKTTGDYIALIRRALAEHRDADARAALTAMRAEFEFADAALPDDLAAWAKRVPRAAR